MDERLKEVRRVLDRKALKFKKRVNIIYDGKQYSIRIPKEYAERAGVDVKTDEFEFVLIMPEDKEQLPELKGELVEK